MLSKCHKIASYALASLSVIGLLQQIPYGTTAFEPEHAKYGAHDPVTFPRGGWNLTSDEACDLLDRWVLLLRTPYTPKEIPKLDVNWTRRVNMPPNYGYMSLGYGLYFRRPGFMIASLNSVMFGGRRTKENHYELDAYYIHRNERYHHEPMDNASSPLIYKPYKLINVKHVYTFLGKDAAVFRVTMSGYKDVYTPHNRREPYERYLDYPEEKYLPDIATRQDQTNSCYIITHGGFQGDKMGFNEFIWKYWPVKINYKSGLRAYFDPHYRRLHFDRKYILGGGMYAHEDTIFPGRICPVISDFGAPIMCHTEDIEWNVAKGMKATGRGGKWKLAYMLLHYPPINENHCQYEYLPALDLSMVRFILFNKLWGDNLGHMW